jgi:Zn-dependent peptidase ImmA (M78 family)
MFPDETIEDEANRFAAEFLMPAAEIGPSLSGLTLERAAGLKAQWRVSMQAIIRRAIVLHEITPAQYTSLCKQINMWGYRVVEPMPVAAEHATLIRAAVDVHIKDHQRTADELRGLTMLSDLVEFRENYISDPTRMFRVLA